MSNLLLRSFYPDDRSIEETTRRLRGGYYPDTVGEYPVTLHNINSLANEWRNRLRKPTKTLDLHRDPGGSKTERYSISFHNRTSWLIWRVLWEPTESLNDYELINYEDFPSNWEVRYWDSHSKMLRKILNERPTLETVQYYRMKGK